MDLLGVRAPVQTIGNTLLNGLTSVTPKLRYLSIVSWIAWRYAQSRFPNDSAEFEDFAAAQEAALALAGICNDSSTTSIVGANEAKKLLDSRKQNFDLVPLVKNIALNIYTSASVDLRLTLDERRPFVLSKEFGLPLAEAFEASISGTAYAKKFVSGRRVIRLSRKEIEGLAALFSFDSLAASERAVLTKALFSPIEPSPIDQGRVATLCLILWLSKHHGRKPDESDLFDAAAAPPRRIPDSLRSTLDGWLDYSIRDSIAVAHESAFFAILRALDLAAARRRGPARAEDVISDILSAEDDHNEVLRELELIGPNASIRNVKFRHVADRLQKKCGEAVVVTHGRRRWREGLNEEGLMQRALYKGPEAAALLPVAWLLAEHRLDTDSTKELNLVLSIGGHFQVGLRDVVLPKLKEFRDSDASYLGVMAELLMRTAQQHLRVAWTRFAVPSGKDVSVMVADGDLWSRHNVFDAGRTESRLFVAIDWLRQLKLINDDGLTQSGERILAKGLADLEVAIS